MPFQFPTDSNNHAGAVRSINGGNDFIVPIKQEQVATVGSEGNAWNAAAASAGDTSAAIDTQYMANVTAFGNVDAATDIIIQVSQDGATFYDIQTLTLTGASDFAQNLTVGARYVRLKTSAAATITATIAAKG